MSKIFEIIERIHIEGARQRFMFKRVSGHQKEGFLDGF